MIERARAGSGRTSEGFTLVELLVALGIIGVLAAIAVPRFSRYKVRAVDSQMESALANARLAMEAYYVDYATYLGTSDEAILAKYGYSSTSDMTLDIAESSPVEFRLCACTTGGTADCFRHESFVGRTTSGCAP